jgi:hypothetical protein
MLAHRARAQHAYPGAIHDDYSTWRATGKFTILNEHFNFIAQRAARCDGLDGRRFAREIRAGRG